ncbi:MAG TPA: hypothetical protein PLW61_08140 [Caldisericia bacterium]|nr:hypothetical protein [Caldisericia bacterium]
MRVKLMSIEEIQKRFPNDFKKCACGCGMWVFDLYGVELLLDNELPYGEIIETDEDYDDPDEIRFIWKGEVFHTIKKLTRKHFETFVEVDDEKEC